MLTDQHPITPPPELVQQWSTEYWGNPDESTGLNEKYIATQAARWGAEKYIATQAARWGDEQRLKAVCEWLYRRCLISGAEELRAAMRPRPLSLVEQALEEIQQMEGAMYSADLGCDFTATRAALERLQHLEQESNDN